MRISLLRSLLTLLVAASAACRVVPVEGSDQPVRVENCDTTTAETEPDLGCLGESIEALRERFNASSDKARLVTLLSPSCGPCQLGGQAVRESVLEAYPELPLETYIVWVDLRPESDLDQARQLARTFEDPRVHQFHDPRRLAGRAFAERLLPTTVAWDVYLFYPPGVRWEDELPWPLFWSHQRGRIAPRNFHPREKLFDQLHEAAGRIAQSYPGPLPPTSPEAVPQQVVAGVGSAE